MLEFVVVPSVQSYCTVGERFLKVIKVEVTISAIKQGGFISMGVVILAAINSNSCSVSYLCVRPKEHVVNFPYPFGF